jgi:glycosyltransferase involved in cell wall biosynthesis
VELVKIALVGGIYGKDRSFRSNLQFTPETILERGLKVRGHQVVAFDHHSSIDPVEFDVVHVHHLSYGAPRLAADNSDTPFVYTSHHGAAMSSSLPGLSRQIAARFVMSRADAVIALSKKEADFQQRNYQLAGAIHRVIPNGIDAANYVYARRNTAGRGRPWQLLYVGQLIAQKDIDSLLRALTLIKRPVELGLAYHNSVLEIPLKKLAVELGLNERVRFLGPKSRSELAALYQHADVFVLPSKCEALPSVITEAMLCGTPVVVTDVGGVREQLGEYGVCVSPGCPDELAAAITFVLDHYEKFAARGQAGSAYARERFSVERMIDEHLELYAHLLDQKGPRRRRTAFRVPVNAAVRVGVRVICATK